MTIEVDGDVPPGLIESLNILPNVIKVVLVRAIERRKNDAGI